MLAAALLTIGTLGFLAMTWLFPAIVLYTRGRVKRTPIDFSSPVSGTPRIAILIPAHNEERNVARTLASVLGAVDFARQTHKDLEVAVCVGADGCKDATPEVARALGANVVFFRKQQGKWKTLSELVAMAEGFDWVILADSGIAWPDRFLAELLPLMADPSTMAVAPTYRTPGAGKVESLVWGIERHFKHLESLLLGGPVSIHGATIAYRRRELSAALEHLGGDRWLNDDVVLPLILRALNPDLRIHYLSNLGVFDDLRESRVPGQPAPREFGRRRRLVYGNIQWMRGLLPLLWTRNWAVALLSLRRAFRVFWAYWGISLAFGGAALIAQPLGTYGLACLAVTGAFGLAFLARRAAFRKLFDSARASLLAPYYFFSAGKTEGIVWK